MTASWTTVWRESSAARRAFETAAWPAMTPSDCYNIFDAALPFGGYKQSGWGREMGEAVLEHYTETKAITVRL